jgi:hypothetical protein
MCGFYASISSFLTFYVIMQVLDSFIWSVLTYFMCGFYASISSFLTFYIIMLSAYVAFAAMFR